MIVQSCNFLMIVMASEMGHMNLIFIKSFGVMGNMSLLGMGNKPTINAEDSRNLWAV